VLTAEGDLAAGRYVAVLPLDPPQHLPPGCGFHRADWSACSLRVLHTRAQVLAAGEAPRLVDSEGKVRGRLRWAPTSAVHDNRRRWQTLVVSVPLELTRWSPEAPLATASQEETLRQTLNERLDAQREQERKDAAAQFSPFTSPLFARDHHAKWSKCAHVAAAAPPPACRTLRALSRALRCRGARPSGETKGSFVQPLTAMIETSSELGVRLPCPLRPRAS
jgi:hypothetical protein